MVSMRGESLEKRGIALCLPPPRSDGDGFGGKSVPVILSRGFDICVLSAILDITTRWCRDETIRNVVVLVCFWVGVLHQRDAFVPQTLWENSLRSRLVLFQHCALPNAANSPRGLSTEVNFHSGPPRISRDIILGGPEVLR
jgi:hypothetical protein